MAVLASCHRRGRIEGRVTVLLRGRHLPAFRRDGGAVGRHLRRLQRERDARAHRRRGSDVRHDRLPVDRDPHRVGHRGPARVGRVVAHIVPVLPVGHLRRVEPLERAAHRRGDLPAGRQQCVSVRLNLRRLQRHRAAVARRLRRRRQCSQRREGRHADQRRVAVRRTARVAHTVAHPPAVLSVPHPGSHVVRLVVLPVSADLPARAVFPALGFVVRHAELQAAVRARRRDHVGQCTRDLRNAVHRVQHRVPAAHAAPVLRNVHQRVAAVPVIRSACNVELTVHGALTEDPPPLRHNRAAIARHFRNRQLQRIPVAHRRRNPNLCHQGQRVHRDNHRVAVTVPARVRRMVADVVAAVCIRNSPFHVKRTVRTLRRRGDLPAREGARRSAVVDTRIAPAQGLPVAHPRRNRRQAPHHRHRVHRHRHRLRRRHPAVVGHHREHRVAVHVLEQRLRGQRVLRPVHRHLPPERAGVRVADVRRRHRFQLHAREPVVLDHHVGRPNRSRLRQAVHSDHHRVAVGGPHLVARLVPHVIPVLRVQDRRRLRIERRVRSPLQGRKLPAGALRRRVVVVHLRRLQRQKTPVAHRPRC